MLAVQMDDGFLAHNGWTKDARFHKCVFFFKSHLEEVRSDGNAAADGNRNHQRFTVSNGNCMNGDRSNSVPFVDGQKGT